MSLDPEILRLMNEINNDVDPEEDSLEEDEDALTGEETPAEEEAAAAEAPGEAPTSEPRFRRRRPPPQEAGGVLPKRRPRRGRLAAGAGTLALASLGFFFWPVTSSEPESGPGPESGPTAPEATASRPARKITFVDYVLRKEDAAAPQIRTAPQRRWRVVPPPPQDANGTTSTQETRAILELADAAELTLDSEEREHVNSFLSEFFDLFLNLVRGDSR